jgi:GalNAc-alpha-(1->4)-GalNAc-alpha-(1->3)-diNAcBac-PP-undecaprenol alpha-1,4-N-acetyl-D-galactosaminyltransferase
MKILFVSRLFDGVSGGIERMSTMMMNDMCERGHEVFLFTWDLDGAKSYYELDDRISWRCLNYTNVNIKVNFVVRLRRFLIMRQLMKASNPDVIIAFQHGVFINTAIAMIGSGIPIIAAEREAPERLNFLKAGRFRFFYFQSFRFASVVTVQIKRYCQGYPSYLRAKIIDIPNPVFPVPQQESIVGKTTNTLLTVGRLGYQKNIKVLLQAFFLISEDFPDWTLAVVGDGEDGQDLENFSSLFAHYGRVIFYGKQKDVHSFYANSQLFCLPSRWEGFPNALAEAMAHGIPCVGFSECAGVNDLIDNGVTGRLVEGIDSAELLAEVLQELMLSKEKREVLGAGAIKSMRAYDPDKVYDQWERLFLGVSTK